MCAGNPPPDPALVIEMTEAEEGFMAVGLAPASVGALHAAPASARTAARSFMARPPRAGPRR